MLKILDNIRFGCDRSQFPSPIPSIICLETDMRCCHHSTAFTMWIGTARSVISVQFKNEDDNDVVALPSQHSASGSAEFSSDSCPTNAHSSLPKMLSAIFFSKAEFFHH